jgi:hypothetical protein
MYRISVGRWRKPNGGIDKIAKAAGVIRESLHAAQLSRYAAGALDGNRSDAMGTMSLRLPESLHRRAKELARQEGISINQLVATALAEKISALAAGEYLEHRAARGSRRKFERVLRKVKDAEPEERDQLR